MRQPFLLCIFLLGGFFAQVFGQTNFPLEYNRVRFTHENIMVGPFLADLEGLIAVEDNSCLVYGVKTQVFGGDNSIYLIKLDSNFKILWNLDIQNQDLGMTNMALATDGNYLLGAVQNQSIFNDRIFQIAKLDTSGALLWSRNYMNPLGDDDRVSPIRMIATNDGGALLLTDWYDSSTLENAMQFNKIDSLGNLMWNRVVSTSSGFRAKAVAEDSLGQFYVVGYDFPLASNIMLLGKFSPTGDLKWIRTYNPSNAQYEPSEIAILDNERLVIAGTYDIDGGAEPRHVFAMALDSSGMNISAAKYFKGFVSGKDGVVRQMITTRENDLLLLGETFNQFGGFQKPFLMRLTPGLDTISTHCYYDGSVETGYAHSVLENDYGLTLVGGETIFPQNDALSVFRTDSLGKINCARYPTNFTIATIPGPFISMAQETLWTKADRDGPTPLQTTDTVSVQIDQVCMEIPVGGDEPTAPESNWTLFPNPSSGTVHFSQALQTGEWSLHDLQGKLLKRSKVRGSITKLDLGPLPKGVYLFHFRSREKSLSHRIFIQ